MSWNRKRLLATSLWALVPYAAWTFVCMDFAAAFADNETRFGLLALTSVAAGMAYTYPGWRLEW